LKKRNPFTIYRAVISTLVLRELNIRFSSGTLGYFWAFFEPFLQILTLIVIKVAIFGRSDDDVDFAVYLALGFISFNMFRHIVSSSANAFKGNRGLFIYRQVRPIDTIVSKVFVELFISSIILVIFTAIGIYFGFDLNVKNTGMVFLAYIWLVIFSFSFALCVAIISFYFINFKKIVSLLIRVMFFTSAIFYTLHSLPAELREYLLYNPMTHFMEMIHGYYFYTLDDRYVSYNYMAIWTVALLYSGLWLYRMLEKRIISNDRTP